MRRVALPSITKKDFAYIQDLVREYSGVDLEDEKEYLAEARLTPLIREEEFSGFEELIDRLRFLPFGSLHLQVIDAILTKETSFFRDISPFEALKKICDERLMKNFSGPSPFHIWSSACSSGQEPYSMALTLTENLPDFARKRVQILATDLSDSMLERAKEGSFFQYEMNRGLPAQLLIKHFEKDGLSWKIKEPLRKMVEFKKINLTKPWPYLPDMDIIFLRNVLIYFPLETKKEILQKVYQILKPEGYLFLGGAETTLNLDDSFERVVIDKAVCYQKKENHYGIS